MAHRSPAAPDDTPAPIRFRDYAKAGKVQPFDLDLRPGEVVGIVGLLGSGRSETAFLLFGIDRPDGGRVEIDGAPALLHSPAQAVRHRFGFCPEERKTDGIVADLSVRENIILALQARRGWARPLPRAEADAIAGRYIRALDIRPADPDRPIKFLSGGNQQKAILARWLATDPRLLILDEPTRGIDIGAHAEIVRLIEELCEGGMALVVISSELEELASYATRVVVMSDHRHVAELSGSEITVGAMMNAMAVEGAA